MAGEKRAGTLRRPSFAALFTGQFRKITLLTAVLSGLLTRRHLEALQLTPTQIVPGSADLAEQQAVLKPLQKAAKELNKKLNQQTPKVKGSRRHRSQASKTSSMPASSLAGTAKAAG